MQQDNKRFFAVAAAIVGIWLLCWLLVWLPNTGKVETVRKKVNHLTQEIAAMSADSASLAEEHIATREQQHKLAGKKLQELAAQVHYETDAGKTGGLSQFRSGLSQKAQELRNKANRIGIVFDESLGFPATIAAANFHDGYWVSLELAAQVISMLLEQSGEERAFQEITKISHPLLNKNVAPAFVQELPVEFTIQAKLAFIVKFVASVSQPRQKQNGDGNRFLKLSQLVLEAVPGMNDGTVQARFTLSALQINPQVPLQATGEAVPTSKPSEPTTPIWERY